MGVERAWGAFFISKVSIFARGPWTGYPANKVGMPVCAAIAEAIQMGTLNFSGFLIMQRSATGFTEKKAQWPH